MNEEIKKRKHSEIQADIEIIQKKVNELEVDVFKAKQKLIIHISELNELNNYVHGSELIK